MAKKQTFADKVAKQRAAGHHHDGEDVLQVVKVRQFVNVKGSYRMIGKTVKVTGKNQSEIFG